jgi:NAD(P)-dependent dehydrogenase (short-subunit alcohol dehydrogenase family)
MGLLSRRPKLKKVQDQTIVITGASSGIGLATARMAAERGARVVMTARNEDDLKGACEELCGRGGRATYVPADVADPLALDRVAEVALRDFGGIDTWVNNAGVSIYGRLIDMPLEDKRRLFDTNFWGVVHGCRTAVRVLRHRGGAIINIGSVVSDRAIPLQGIYSASKHAVQGYTDALRMELEHDGYPISLTLVKPAATDTPYVDHARNYMEEAPTLPPPVYSPEVVAEAILRCAEKRIREITVGGGGRMMAVMGIVAPRTSDIYMERALYRQQKDPERVRDTQDSLYSPGRDGRAHGPYEGYVMQSSIYTKAMLSDVTRALPFVAAGFALAAGVQRYRRNVDIPAAA